MISITKMISTELVASTYLTAFQFPPFHYIHFLIKSQTSLTQIFFLFGFYFFWFFKLMEFFMEHTFQRNFFAFFSEIKLFNFYFQKATTSFLKLNYELACLLVFLLKCLWHLVFEGPSLIKWHSPNHYTHVERSTPANFPRSF